MADTVPVGPFKRLPSGGLRRLGQVAVLRGPADSYEYERRPPVGLSPSHVCETGLGAPHRPASGGRQIRRANPGPAHWTLADDQRANC